MMERTDVPFPRASDGGGRRLGMSGDEYRTPLCAQQSGRSDDKEVVVT